MSEINLSDLPYLKITRKCIDCFISTPEFYQVKGESHYWCRDCVRLALRARLGELFTQENQLMKTLTCQFCHNQIKTTSDDTHYMCRDCSLRCMGAPVEGE